MFKNTMVFFIFFIFFIFSFKKNEKNEKPSLEESITQPRAGLTRGFLTESIDFLRKLPNSSIYIIAEEPPVPSRNLWFCLGFPYIFRSMALAGL